MLSSTHPALSVLLQCWMKAGPRKQVLKILQSPALLTKNGLSVIRFASSMGGLVRILLLSVGDISF